MYVKEFPCHVELRSFIGCGKLFGSLRDDRCAGSWYQVPREILHSTKFPPLSRASNFMATYHAILVSMSARNIEDSAATAQKTTTSISSVHAGCIMNQNNIPMCNVQSEHYCSTKKVGEDNKMKYLLNGVKSSTDK